MSPPRPDPESDSGEKTRLPLGGSRARDDAAPHPVAAVDAEATDPHLPSMGTSLALGDPAGDAPTAQVARFDGQVPDPGVCARALQPPIQAPLQSRTGRRAAALYQQVLNQFAVGHNPRYDPEPDGCRAHVFVWDVSCAMNVELPHFAGAKELSLAQTCDWLRLEGPMRGWHQTDAAGAIDAAAHGRPVIASPVDPKLSLLAMVSPPVARTGIKLRVSAAALRCGNQLSLREAFGVAEGRFYFHL